jgi:uncharacterized protein
MASANRKWLPLVLIAIATAASVAAYPSVPASVALRLDGVLPFVVSTPPREAPREFALFLLPAMALLLWAAFRAAPTAAGQRIARRMFRHAPDAITAPEQFARFDSTYDVIVLGVIALVVGLHAAILAAALDYTALATRIIPVVLGASFVLMGNVMPRLRPNWVAGVRTRRTLSDPALWRATHRVFGIGFVIAGVVTIAVGLIAPRFGLTTGIVGIVLACVAAVLVSTSRSPRASVIALTAAAMLSSAAQAQAGAIAQPVPPATVAETTFTFTSAGLVLDGTLATPRSSSANIPVVLIVAGSGPTDRNANGPLINTNAYAMLAWELAAHGIASMRYDKRGLGRSTPPPTYARRALSIDDYMQDVVAGAAALRASAKFSRIILLGHSEGAGHVLMAANRGAVADGVIMVAGQGRRLTQLLHDQFSLQADSATVERIDSAFVRLLRGDDIGDVPAIARPVINPMTRLFMQSLAAYDPPLEASRLTQPLLILQGTTDVQVIERDAELLAEAQPKATVVRLPDVNHVLKVVPSLDLQVQSASYRDPSLPLAAGVVPAIVDWLARIDRY